MRRINGSGPVYYQFESLAGHNTLTHGIFTRLGGVSAAPWSSLNLGGTVGDNPHAVNENLQRAYHALDLDPARACTVWQVHSADTVLVHARADNRRWLARADGMITNQRGVPLSMRFADCTPIVLYDPDHDAIGLAHAGWRGTVQNMAGRIVQAMQAAFGTQPEALLAGIGPAIGPDRYQVGPEVVEATAEAFGGTDGLVHRASDGSAYLDLWAANRTALERAGVRQIEIAGICTASHTDEFFSHRAERGKTGRFGVMIALRE
ncbi:MAG TPA: peptidoglycan editing factor PgeF [Aggregatilinea sp.]|uniref:peptidoglycan editing factor PgeF n=1 Tax=Aggregatilinea sp. TaxID=2806333 RepID=UPI002CB233D0|nr:peptidoglycan editing factor PgeF [Aggregatilinea sp.]HML21048.1 peptidoglycan editing factor PgeF [Aggregatilinea sp.]